MSSIYKKGRDGYFYYQAYVLNPKSGKKDKRIFHSLGTKFLEEAERKKYILDKKYQSFPIKKKKHHKFFYTSVTIFTLGVIIYFSRMLFSEYEIALIQNNKVSKIDKKNSRVQKETNSLKKDEVLVTLDTELKIDENISLKSKIKKIPNYNIERVQNISGKLNQVKIFLTIQEESTSENIKMLCESVSEDYSSFSNIIISVYDNSENGIALAKGMKSKITIEDEIKSWIALFTYNPKEGYFFDDEPSKFLRNN